MLSYVMTNGLVFGAVTPHDAAWLLIGGDLMALCMLVKFWGAAGGVGSSRAVKRPHEETAKPEDRSTL